MLLAGVRMKDKRPVINWLAAPGVCVRVCVCTTGLVFFSIFTLDYVCL